VVGDLAESPLLVSRMLQPSRKSAPWPRKGCRGRRRTEHTDYRWAAEPKEDVVAPVPVRTLARSASTGAATAPIYPGVSGRGQLGKTAHPGLAPYPWASLVQAAAALVETLLVLPDAVGAHALVGTEARYVCSQPNGKRTAWIDFDQDSSASNYNPMREMVLRRNGSGHELRCQRKRLRRIARTVAWRG